MNDSSLGSAGHRCPQCGYASGSPRIRTDIAEDLPISVQNIINSNGPPPHSDALDLKQRLNEAEHFLLDAKEEIRQLEARIRFLSNQRAKVAAHAAMYREALHPIRRLPAEVLLEIFSWCSWWDGAWDYKALLDISADSFKNDIFDMNAAPWLLTRVSHYWRNLALSSPRLWTTVAVDFDNINGSEEEKELAPLLLHYLELSRDLPLTIVIANESGSPLGVMLSILCSHSSRWEKASLAMTARDIQLLSSFVKGYLPLLSHVSLACLGEGVEDSLVIDGFQYAPKLRTTETAFIPNISRCLLLPWAQLYEYTAHLSGDVAFDPDAISQSTALRELSVIVDGDTLGLGTLPVVQHDSIRSFNLSSSYNTALTLQILNILSLPHLTTLIVSFSIGDAQLGYDDIGPALLRFIERSTLRHLRTLKIYGDLDKMSEDLIPRLLATVPTVTELAIGSITDGVLRALVCTENTTALLLPRLTNLVLESMAWNDELLLLQMIDSRISMSNGTRLEAVTLPTEFKSRNPEAQACLEELCSKGCSIRFAQC